MRRFFSFFLKNTRAIPFSILYDSREMAASSSSSLTEAEIDKLTASKLRKLLDAKEIAYEKKELKAALAAKLKDAMRKEKEGKEEEEEEEEEKTTTKKKRKASSGGSEEEEPSEEERGEEGEEEEEDSDEEDFDEYEDDGSVEWMLRMHQKIARPKNKRDWEIRESVLSGGGIP